MATPFTVGVKTTPVVQLSPAARVEPHVFWVRLNGGETARIRPLAELLLALVTVAICAAPGWPSVICVKVIWDGLIENPDKDCPVPVSGTWTGSTPEVDEETVSVAES